MYRLVLFTYFLLWLRYRLFQKYYQFFFGIGSVAFGGLVIGSWRECKYYNTFSEEHYDYRLFCLWKRIFKIIIPFFVVCLVLTICIPDKETLISMKIASLATKENISLTADAIKELVDYIVDAISKIK